MMKSHYLSLKNHLTISSKCYKRVGQTHSRRAVNKTIVKEEGKIVAKDWSHLLHKNGCPNPNQLETLGAQWAGLEDMLKEMKRKNDILSKLMTSTGSYEDLFRKEISKYDRISEDIAHNIEAQEQLLLQIQAQNDDFSAIFNLEDYKASREKCYKQIQAAIAKF